MSAFYHSVGSAKFDFRVREVRSRVKRSSIVHADSGGGVNSDLPGVTPSWPRSVSVPYHASWLKMLY